MNHTATIALAGNPNSGKTTLFNAITGARQHVGNYPGITVERKEGSLNLNDTRVNIVDLPGCYSLSAFSQEELVARKVLVDERPDIVVDIVDATKLERHLYLAIQFFELGIPVMLTLNMMDEANKKGLRIDTEKLSTLLKCPVVETVARSGEGKQELLEKALHYAADRGGVWEPLEISYGADLDTALNAMVEKIEAARFMTNRYPARWVALKYLESDDEIVTAGRSIGSVAFELEEMVSEVDTHCRTTLNTTPEALIADYRYGLINSILRQDIIERPQQVDRRELTDKLDNVLTNRLFGPLIMFGVLYAMFQITFTLGEIPMGWFESFFGWLGNTATALIPDGMLQSLIVSGVIDGVGGVMGFVPLIAIMFLMIAFLEDSGYMARVAYMLDRVLRMFGLHGCSAMPFIISGGIMGGCAVPGVMATRTLRSPKEKLATLITAPFMPCGAKLPVFLLLIAAFFSENEAQIMFSITLGAWAMALLVSKLLRSTIIKGEPTPFVMELPPYRLPTLRGVLIHTWERVWQYIRKAGTVILAVSILLWAAMTFPQLPENQVNAFNQQRIAVATNVMDMEQRSTQLEKIDNQEAQATLRYSVAGQIGSFFEPVSQWAGFDWRTNIALVGGFAAKEVIVSTFGTAYSLGEIDPEEAAPLSHQIATDPSWNKYTAISLIIFVLLYAPCFVTVVTMAKESSWGWAVFSTVFNTALGFGLAVAVYQVGTRLLT
ncbi:ferrous iron transport protein B [Desulfuromonas acetoxidans]|uniref:Ferrous iron transport protein B n=1 Tax=Desulfuromonas acetoxidans (strain DSM 684 / 11070) TaxID=281689 RepID=Q1JWZ9_DESA6|nr:ferrous iron transport protein B [Desulfuromonas acetoxidans]EAT14759.1 ferrous iron transport protein B [Desulfuromonas acetoxidans DSM 684]MBF0646974.1 ferrous iron transport protein B [Desulfuromonas acetoxidans]NVD25012.1 ferrous iron transport protein B [Desulfuromonas acetoxidans]NVE17057.1 ferrous iron transport protein B [Desulfuromonas acetoxidans]